MMAKCWDIAIKNLKMIVRDKKVVFLLFLIPVAYYILNGAIVGGIDVSISQKQYNIGWVDNDSSESHDPFKNLDFLQNMTRNIKIFNIQNCSSNESANVLLNEKKLDAYIVFSEGYEIYMNGLAPKPVNPVIIYYSSTSDEMARNIIGATINETINALFNSNPAAIDIYIEQKAVNGKYLNNMTSYTPGLLMLGALLILISGVVWITQEKKEGLINRLESSEMEPKDVILGNLIVNTFFISIIEIIGFILLTIFGFKLISSNLVSVILGSILLILAYSMFQNGLTMVIATLVKKPEAVAGAAWGFMVPLGFLSGLFFPLELLSPGLIPYVTWIPTRIGVILFREILINNTSVLDLAFILPLIELILEGILFNYLAIKMYRKFALAKI
jgi:ABC-type multidrug transport system permease subunit